MSDEQPKKTKTPEEIKADKEYLDIVKKEIHISNEKDDFEVFMKGYLTGKVYSSFYLEYYDRGEIYLFDEEDKVYGGKILIVKYSEDTVQEETEKYGSGVKLENTYLQEEYILLSRKEVSYFEINQSSCPDPECENCKKGNKPPVVLAIITNSKPITILFFSQSEAFYIMAMLTHWKEGNAENFLKDPFNDDVPVKTKTSKKLNKK